MTEFEKLLTDFANAAYDCAAYDCGDYRNIKNNYSELFAQYCKAREAVVDAINLLSIVKEGE